jgi:hypothetical protein
MTSIANNFADYSVATKATGEAIKADEKTSASWKKAGPLVASHFGTIGHLEEQKAQFIADAIAPYVDAKHAKALLVELPRKNGKEYAAKKSENAGYVQYWEAANQAKKDARSTFDTYFTRIVKYAFPVGKDETAPEPAPVSLKTKIQNDIAALVKKCEKAEGADFDLVATLAALQNVLTVVNK